MKQCGHTIKLGFFSIHQKQSINLCNGNPLHLQAQRQLKHQNQKIKTNEPCLLKSCMLCCSNLALNIILGFLPFTLLPSGIMTSVYKRPTGKTVLTEEKWSCPICFKTVFGWEQFARGSQTKAIYWFDDGPWLGWLQ